MESLLNDPNIKEIFKRFNESGFEIYLVGGAVRDFYLNDPINDIDFTTNAKPDEIISLFENTMEIGKRFGTIKVCLNNCYYEITTYRTENNYSDSRHPETLEFTDNLKEDLSRRDFTINGLCLSKENQLIDLFNGISDLKQKIIRTIGNPEERFKEDQLRKWRAVRLAVEKNFNIEKNTLTAISNHPNTDNISIERIRDELNRIIKSENRLLAAQLFNQTGLFKELLKRVGIKNNYLLSKEYLKTTFRLLNQLKSELPLLYSALLIPMSFEEAQIFLSGLKFSKNFQNQVFSYKKAINYLNQLIELNSELTNYELKRIIRYTNKDNSIKVLQLIKEKAKLENNFLLIEKLEKAIKQIKLIIEKNEPTDLKDLKLNGNDIKDLGYKGQEIKIVLDYLLDFILKNPDLNEKSILLKEIKNAEFNFPISNKRNIKKQ